MVYCRLNHIQLCWRISADEQAMLNAHVQCISKATIKKTKQVEHVLNERALLETINSDFTVRLLGAYQDAHNLMLLQEWVGGARS